MRLAEGSLKKQIQNKTFFFLKKHEKHFVFTPPLPPPLPPRSPGPSVVLVLFLGALLCRMGRCGGGSGALCALGLDAPWA
jgi:hypothetical protein